MTRVRQNPLARFAQNPPVDAATGVKFEATLDDERRGTVVIRHGETAVALNAVGLAVPYPSGLARLRATDPDTELVVVERVPPGLERVANEQGINYLDLAGAGHISAPGLVYVVGPRSGLAGLARSASRSSPFATKASRVVRALLTTPADTPWRLTDLAALTKLNPGNVHRVLSELVDLGHVERDVEAYVVPDPGSLLEAWADQHHAPKDYVKVPVVGDLREDVTQVLDRADGDAVVSGELGAELLAPHLPSRSAIIHLFSPSILESRRGHSARRSVIGAATPSPDEITLVLADPGVGEFQRIVDGLPVAAPQQIYVDLSRDRGRAREAAEHLRATALPF